MSRKKRPQKVTPATKITLGTVCVLGVVGGWNLIGRQEMAAANVPPAPTADMVQVQPAISVPPAPTPWPAIAPLARAPRLEIGPLPTLAVPARAIADVAEDEMAVAFTVAPAPSVAALAALDPLPALPEYVPPPPPPPRPVAVASNSGGGGGGSNTSRGS